MLIALSNRKLKPLVERSEIHTLLTNDWGSLEIGYLNTMSDKSNDLATHNGCTMSFDKGSNGPNHRKTTLSLPAYDLFTKFAYQRLDNSSSDLRDLLLQERFKGNVGGLDDRRR